MDGTKFVIIKTSLVRNGSQTNEDDEQQDTVYNDSIKHRIHYIYSDKTFTKSMQSAILFFFQARRTFSYSKKIMIK